MRPREVNHRSAASVKRIHRGAAIAEELAKQGVEVVGTPLGRIGRPRDIASVVSFLASDEAGWITGQMIPVGLGLRA